MRVGIVTSSVEEAQQLASWLQLWCDDWIYLPPEMNFNELEDERDLLIIAVDGWYVKEELEQRLPGRFRLIVLPPLEAGKRVAVCGIIALASKQYVELTMEELQHFTGAGFVVLMYEER